MILMKTTDLHPDEVLKELLAKQNRRDKTEKLAKLHDLCAAEYDRHSQGARDLSLSNISKLAEINGLFKARTIYNSQSIDYATLIKAWDAHNGPKQFRPNKKATASSEKYPFLKKIEDPAIRSLCQIAFAERDKLKVELNLLKSKTVITIDMRPLGSHARTGSSQPTSAKPAMELTDSEHTALSAAIDPATLAKKGWRLGDTGEVIDERKRFVFYPGFATGIAKILT